MGALDDVKRAMFNLEVARNQLDTANANLAAEVRRAHAAGHLDADIALAGDMDVVVVGHIIERKWGWDI